MLSLLLSFLLFLLYSTPTIYLLYRFYLRLNTTYAVAKELSRMDGRTVIVTGASSGIGFEIAMGLAARGARVVLACKNIYKARVARLKMILATGNYNITVKYLDLRSFASVTQFVDKIHKSESKLDVLINNAGTVSVTDLTCDSLPTEVQINYYSPFLLTLLLLPLLKKSQQARIINVSSALHKLSKLDIYTLHKKSTPAYNRWNLFVDMNLAILLFTNKLSRELHGTRVIANAVDPGRVYTELFRNRHPVSRFILKLLLKTPEQGAQTAIDLASSPCRMYTNGNFFSNCQKIKTSKYASDNAIADTLWSITEAIVMDEPNSMINIGKRGLEEQ